MSEELSDLLKIRREKMEEFRAGGMEPFPYSFNKACTAADILAKYKDLKEGEEGSDEVVTAGRIVLKRGHGKAAFAHIQDETGRVQVYGKIDLLGEQPYGLYQKLDIGDFIGVTGKVFRTRTGEITVRLSSFTLLGKSLHPLPEKWHGLSDKEVRYRERYLDLIVNPDVKAVFVKRSRIISFIRRTLEGLGFLEVETPILHVLQGGAAAKPFETYHEALDMPLFLRIAPELYLKRLLVGGFEKVFELGRVFRNEGMSYKHNPEYTMIEIYQAYTDYNGIMKLTEDLVAGAAQGSSGHAGDRIQGRKDQPCPALEKDPAARRAESRRDRPGRPGRSGDQADRLRKKGSRGRTRSASARSSMSSMISSSSRTCASRRSSSTIRWRPRRWPRSTGASRGRSSVLS